MVSTVGIQWGKDFVPSPRGLRAPWAREEAAARAARGEAASRTEEMMTVSSSQDHGWGRGARSHMPGCLALEPAVSQPCVPTSCGCASPDFSSCQHFHQSSSLSYLLRSQNLDQEGPSVAWSAACTGRRSPRRASVPAALCLTPGALLLPL